MVLHFEHETRGHVLNTYVPDQDTIWGYVDEWEVMLLWPDCCRNISFLAHCHVNAFPMCFLP